MNNNLLPNIAASKQLVIKHALRTEVNYSNTENVPRQTPEIKTIGQLVL